MNNTFQTQDPSNFDGSDLSSERGAASINKRLNNERNERIVQSFRKGQLSQTAKRDHLADKLRKRTEARILENKGNLLLNDIRKTKQED